MCVCVCISSVWIHARACLVCILSACIYTKKENHAPCIIREDARFFQKTRCMQCRRMDHHQLHRASSSSSSCILHGQAIFSFLDSFHFFWVQTTCVLNFFLCFTRFCRGSWLRTEYRFAQLRNRTLQVLSRAGLKQHPSFLCVLFCTFPVDPVHILDCLRQSSSQFSSQDALFYLSVLQLGFILHSNIRHIFSKMNYFWPIRGDYSQQYVPANGHPSIRRPCPWRHDLHRQSKMAVKSPRFCLSVFFGRKARTSANRFGIDGSELNSISGKAVKPAASHSRPFWPHPDSSLSNPQEFNFKCSGLSFFALGHPISCAFQKCLCSLPFAMWRHPLLHCVLRIPSRQARWQVSLLFASKSKTKKTLFFWILLWK
jgi:hypothetical protein